MADSNMGREGHGEAHVLLLHNREIMHGGFKYISGYIGSITRQILWVFVLLFRCNNSFLLLKEQKHHSNTSD